jgi:molecular chaperone DnaK
MASPAVGIDLGTTNSVVAVSIQGKPQVIIDPTTGSSLIPSVVSFPEAGGRIVGRAARARKAFDPAHTVSSVKRLLGRPFKSEEVRRARSRVAFDLKEGADSAVLVQTRAGAFSLPEVSAMVLREVRRVAEEATGQRVERCVVTVPANFNELQRSSTKIAGKIAELDVVRILNEPTAAALAYGYGRNTREKICIYDFGGGTFDVTLLELNGNVFEVLSTWGDTFLGGDDVDLAITDWLVPHLLRATGIDGAQDRLAFDILRDAAEMAKCSLSQRDATRVEFNYAQPGASGPVRFEHTLTRSDLDRLATPFVEKTFSVCQEALKLAGLRPNDLTAVILVGGSTRIPGLHGRVAQFFGRDPLTHLPPEEVVGLGAAILAEALTPGARRNRQTPMPMTAPPQPPPIAPTSVPPPIPMAGRAPTLGGAFPSPPVSAVPPPMPVSNLRGPTLAGPGGGPPPPPPVRSAPPPPPGVTRPSQVPPPTPQIPSMRSTQLGAPPRPPMPPPIPGPPALPSAASVVAFDLDDPFVQDPTESRTVSIPLSPYKPTPLPGALPGLTDLDEPSFMGNLPQGAPAKPMFDQPIGAYNLDDDSVATPIPTPAMVAAAARHDPDLPANPAPLPANIAPGLPELAPELPMMTAELPSVSAHSPLGAPADFSPPPPPMKPILGAPPRPSSPSIQAVPGPSAGFASALASLPPSIAAAIRPPPPRPSSPEPLVDEPTTQQPAVTDASVPSFRLDASLFGDEPKGASSSDGKDLSVPSFRIDAEDIFGASSEPGSGTMVAKSPFESSLPGLDPMEVPSAPEPSAPALPPPPDPFARPPVVSSVSSAPRPSPTAPPSFAVRESESTQRGPALDEATRTMPAVTDEDPNFPPLVVPAPVRANVDAIRANAPRSSAPPAGAAIGRVSLVSSPVGGDTLKPGLPPAPHRPSAPGPGPMSAPPAAPPSAPPAATLSGAPARNTNAAGIAVPLLLDVTPLSLGVETAGGQCEVVIRRNATIPVEQSRVFATTNDNQTSVIIRIAQGESRKFTENQTLGELELAGLRAAPRGEVSISVTFELGADGTLSVRAKDVETNREQFTRVSLLTIPSESSQAEMAARQRPPQTATA